jgi:acetyltransferase-like isoleucine patch superfamily enzyme
MENAIVRKNVTLGDNVIIHPNVVIEEGIHIGEGSELFPGTYIGKTPKGAGATLRAITFDKIIKIGSNCAIGPNAVIFYEVEIGNNTLIGDGASIREKVKIGNRCLISRYVTINYNSIIGNDTKIMDLTHITGNCIIGNNVFISIHVSTVNDNVVINRKYSDQSITGPRIEDDSTIGANAIILPGIIIGKGAMVGAGSIVTKNVEPDTLVMGTPARYVRSLKLNSP